MKTDELADFIKTAGKAQRAIDFECPFVEGFYVQIVFGNKFIMNQIYDAARETSAKSGPESITVPGYKGQIPIDKLNREKLRAAYAQHLTLGWKGLTIRRLQDIIPGLGVDLTLERAKKLFPDLAAELEEVKTDADLQKVIEKVEVPYSIKLTTAMLEVSTEFENWILFTATDIQNYSVIAEEKKKEIENLN